MLEYFGATNLVELFRAIQTLEPTVVVMAKAGTLMLANVASVYFASWLLGRLWSFFLFLFL